MEIILLTIIAGLLALHLLHVAVGDEDPVVLIVGIPMLAIAIIISSSLIFMIAWGIKFVLEFFGFYL